MRHALKYCGSQGLRHPRVWPTLLAALFLASASATGLCGEREEADALYKQGFKLEDESKFEQAENVYRKLIETFPKQTKLCQESYYRLGQCAYKRGSASEAIALYDKIVALWPRDHVAAGRALYTKGLCLWQRFERDTAAGCFRQAMMQYPENIVHLKRAQLALVKVLLEQEKFSEALAEAKIAFMVCDPDATPLRETSENVVKSLIGVHGGKTDVVLQWLKFQRHGAAGEDGKPGTADDLTNPLDAVKPPQGAERDQALAEALSRQPKTYWGRRTSGYIALVQGQPREALEHFRAAYPLAPNDNEGLPMAVNDLVVALKAVTGHTLLSEPLLNFIQYGPNGPDKQPGTADDLSNPLESL